MEDQFKFIEWPKIPRLRREMVISEKIDGTNGCIYIEHLSLVPQISPTLDPFISVVGDFAIAVGSRSRWIKPGDDNYGFAAWVQTHAHELVKLGPGRHYGEWWGAGIQRKYGLKEKRFSLFNVGKWQANTAYTEPGILAFGGDYNSFISCCYVVPTLYRGPFSTPVIKEVLDKPQERGSYAAPGFMNPEGVVVYHEAARQLFKQTIEKDEGKG